VEEALRGHGAEKGGQVSTAEGARVLPAPGPSGIRSPRSFREVWLITAGHALTHWYPSTFYLLLPIIGRELGLSFSQIGLIMTCQYVAGAVANVPGGVLVDTVGRKGVLMALSLFWVGFPYLLMGFSHGYLMLLGCVALVGFGNSLWHPTAIPTLARTYPDRKGLVLSIHGMGGNLGDALAPLVVGSLLTWLTWREVVVVNVIPGLVMAFTLLLMLGTLTLGAKAGGKADGATQGIGDYVRGLPALFRNRSLVVLTMSSAFRSMTQNALLTFLPIYLAYEMGYSVFWVGAAMFALQAAGFAATPIAGHLSDRMGRRGILMSSMGMTAVVLVFMALAGRSHAFAFFVAILGFFLYAVRPVLQAWILESTPKNMGGTSIGILFGAQALGASVAPLVAGVIADRHGLTATFWFLAATIVVANLFIFGVPKEAAGRVE
jgi:MFS family permease